MKDLFTEIRAKAFVEFSQAIDDTVVVLQTPSEAKFREASDYVEVWEIKTGLYDDSEAVWLIEDLIIYIAFTNQFPLETPKIFYNQNDFDKLGYIPHSSYLRNDVCVFDDFVVVDQTNPSGIIQFQYEKAKNILIDGIKGLNEPDFEDEFIAYWGTSANLKDKLLKGQIYSLVENEPTSYDDVAILFYRLESKNKTDDYSGGIIFNKNEILIDSYKKYFEESKIDFKEHPAFYIGEKTEISKPPFAIKFGNTLNFINKNNHIAFQSYISKTETGRFVIFKKIIKSETYYLGWHYPEIDTKMNGFRSGKLTQYQAAFSKMLPNYSKYVTRISSEKLNEERLIKRTASDSIPQSKFKFLVAGIGSVGSNLAAMLNSLNNPEFILVDNEELDSENLKRHFLGFKYLGVNKASALKHFFQDKLPSQKIHTEATSIFDYCNSNIQIFNEQDYIFLCLGKLNLEKWFIEQIRNKEIKKPIFILWVEPYLIGGQLLFIHPDDVPNTEDLFTEIFKYKFSVISHDEFEKKRELFTLKESGCQTTFSPYSSTHLSLFLSAIHQEIFSIIENDSKKSEYISWVGDLNIANNLDVKVRDKSFEKYTLIKNKL